MTTRPAGSIASPKPPGRLSLAARRKREHAARIVMPYAGGLAVATGADLALHQPVLLGLGIGGAAMHAGIRLHEAHGWHRSGGKAAARKRRRYQGWASRRDIGRLRRLGPDRATPPLVLGAAKGRTVAVHRENSVLYIGPPGYGKTAALACHAADAPGALFATSTKTGLLLDTVNYRAGKGRIWILNADGYGGVPNTLAWSPVDGCRNPQIAQRRAGDFAQASPRSGNDGAYWTGMGAGLIAVALHAAAVTGGSMREVTAWCRNPWAAELKDACALPGADPMLAGKLASLIGGEGEHLNGIIGAAEAALAWMDDPVMAAIACPAPGEGFDAREFARSSDSVYLIGKKRPFGSLAPYNAALGAEVFEQLKWHAMESPSGRLPVPATYVLDEMPLTCPMAVHDMLAEAREYMITITAGAQSLSQLRSVWGKDDGDTIRSAAPVEVIFGGEKRAEDLEALSAVIGKQDTWHHAKGNDGSRTKQQDTQLLMPPEALHSLAKRKAVILAPACRPVLAGTPAIWERPGHVRADLGAFTAWKPSAQPAVAAPRREAIPMPPAPPSAVTQAPAVPALSGPSSVTPVPDYAPEEATPWHATTRG